MSDASDKEVSPLRLKRPGSPVPPPASSPEAIGESPAAPASPPFSAAAPASPVVPLPGSDAASDVIATPPRRRPTLASDPISKAPAPSKGSVITGDMLIGGLPNSPSPSAPAAEEAVPPPVKLRVGARPAPPPPAPVPGLPDDPFAGSDGMPLVPLPGLPAMPSLASLPPLPGQPAAPVPAPSSRPQGTVPIGDGAPGTKAPGFRIASADAPLMPLGMTTSTAVPFPGGAGTPPPLPGRVKKAKSHSARRDLLLFALIFLLLAAGGVGAYFYLTKPEASAEALAGMKEKLEKAAEMPGKAVDNAKESMSKARSAEQDRIDSVIEGRETPETRGIPAASGAELEARLKAANGATGGTANALSGSRPASEKTLNQVSVVAPPASADAGAGVANGSAQTTGNPAAPAVPVAGARFVRYAEKLSVSGVFQGNPARALVDGRIVRSGDILEPVLGIKFVGVDSETKHLILQDATGAQLRVKY